MILQDFSFTLFNTFVLHQIRCGERLKTYDFVIDFFQSLQPKLFKLLLSNNVLDGYCVCSIQNHSKSYQVWEPTLSWNNAELSVWCSKGGGTLNFTIEWLWEWARLWSWPSLWIAWLYISWWRGLTKCAIGHSPWHSFSCGWLLWRFLAPHSTATEYGVEMWDNPWKRRWSPFWATATDLSTPSSSWFPFQKPFITAFQFFWNLWAEYILQDSSRNEGFTLPEKLTFKTYSLFSMTSALNWLFPFGNSLGEPFRKYSTFYSLFHDFIGFPFRNNNTNMFSFQQSSPWIMNMQHRKPATKLTLAKIQLIQSYERLENVMADNKLYLFALTAKLKPNFIL